MKESKILKIISYLTLMLLISMLILSVFTISVKENNSYYDEEQYFSSQSFASDYMVYLKEECHNLIYNNGSYHSIQDGDIEIHYSTDEPYYYNDIKNRYFLIIYKNKAFTNVELTSTTNTIESIKSYIKENENGNKVDIIYGEINSESEIIQNIGIQYLDFFKQVYYTTENNKKENITVEAKDLQIYSSYVEEFRENSEQAVISRLMDKFSLYEEYSYFIIPASVVLIILLFVYLLISTGHEKGIQGIALNDLDKIPLEIVLFVAMIIGCIPVIILEMINQNYSAIISLIITEYLVIYILCMITLNTIVKRIKAKSFWKTTIIGKILIWINKYLKKIYNKYVSIYDTITYSTKITSKVFIFFGILIPTGIFFLFAFENSFITFLFELILISSVAYKIIKVSKDFAEIENKLKEMYEGNNKNVLNKEDFGVEFHSTIKYLNDISNGFENAIQDRIKSERLKAELITNVSHDIKTPLTSIINYVDLLKQENIQNEKAKEYIGILDNKSQRLKKLTEDLVEASKISTGNVSLNFEKINIVELIKQALGEFKDRFAKRGLEVILDYKESEVNISADSKYMYRIIENLFSNISKYALENSRVYIDIKNNENHVKIEMKNISKERLNISADELMQRFVRGDKSRTTEGSGLGISIAQNLTELQNGKFRLKLDGDLFKIELEW